MNLLGKVIPQQVQSELEGLTVVVRTLSGCAEPVRGVLNSPITEHIWREPAQPVLLDARNESTEASA